MNLLYPQTNEFRSQTNLNGLWQFDIDPQNNGEARAFPAKPALSRVIAVPGSWNEQFTGLHNYLQTAWYSREVFIRTRPARSRTFLRLGAATNHCKAWVNGTLVGEYRLGYLPAVFDVTKALREGVNRVAVKVDSILTDRTLPTSAFDRGHWAAREMAADYFPYSGLHRDVELFTVPADSLVNLKVETTLAKSRAIVNVKLWTWGNVKRVRLSLIDGDMAVASAEADISGGKGDTRLTVRRPVLWSPDNPHLYLLRTECLDKRGRVCDRYDQEIGVRTVAVTETQLLLNGKPITLRGFSRHEDFPIVGRGHVAAVMVRDFELMKWIGANSFRTSHYPYDERQYQMADRLGFLVIDEAPAVSLFMPKQGQDPDSLINEEVKALHFQAVRDMQARDWNHPSVIAWSMANECNGDTDGAYAYFGELCRMAKERDASRLIVHTNCRGKLDRSHAWADMICMNHYDYACNHPGRDMHGVVERLNERLDYAHQTLKKPVFLSEFGICGIPGFHSLAPLYFTEEGQVDHVFHYLDVARTKDFCVGVHIWLLHDFKAQESNGRSTQNFKGMFDRLRQPKLIAHRLKDRWATPGV